MGSEAHIAGQRVLFASSKAMQDVADESVKLVITSPPYWNLKDYGDSEAEIGSGSYASDYPQVVADVIPAVAKLWPTWNRV